MMPVPWSVEVTVEPTVEPVTVAEAKAQCRVDASDEDDLFTGWIAAARRYVEMRTGRTFYQTTRKLWLDYFPARGVILLPYGPVIAVSAVGYTDPDGDAQTVSSASYHVDTTDHPARLCLDGSASWPSTDDRPRAVSVTYTCGYATDAGGIASLEAQRAQGRQAVLLLVADWYRIREASIIGGTPARTAFSVDALLDNEADVHQLMARMV